MLDVIPTQPVCDYIERSDYHLLTLWITLPPGQGEPAADELPLPWRKSLGILSTIVVCLLDNQNCPWLEGKFDPGPWKWEAVQLTLFQLIKTFHKSTIWLSSINQLYGIYSTLFSDISVLMGLSQDYLCCGNFLD